MVPSILHATVTSLSSSMMLFAVLLSLVLAVGRAQARLVDYADPMVGTAGPMRGSNIAGGNTFPGATRPWGMVKLGVDTSYQGLPAGYAVDVNSGYSAWGNVTGISMMHVTGTGGTPTYGLVHQMPLTGDVASSINLADNTTYGSNRSQSDDRAAPGFFYAKLDSGIGINLTASRHAGIARYSFDGQACRQRHVLVDLAHVLPANSSFDYTQKFVEGQLDIDRHSYRGFATYSGGWSQAPAHKIHFCARFNQESQSSQTFSYSYDAFHAPSTSPKPKDYRSLRAYAGSGQAIGALFGWAGKTDEESCTLESRIGISYDSAARACRYIDEELPWTTSFSDAVKEAQQDWEEEVLSTVEVHDDKKNATLARMLYSALYHSALMPTDKSGNESPQHWPRGVDNFDDHYTIWDTFQTTMPLYHLLFTSTYSRVLQGLVNAFKYDGFLPTGRSAQTNGRVQGGTHADMVLADAYLKSRHSAGQSDGGEIRGIDWETAWKAMINDAEVEPVHNVDPVSTDGATKEGRGALDEYLRFGYVTPNHTRSISRSLEYSYNDAAIYLAGRAMSRDPEELKRLKLRARADWWQNIWNRNLTASFGDAGNFSAFPAPRLASGQFNVTGFDPLNCAAGCGWNDYQYESVSAEGSFASAPHDTARVVELMGGPATFLKRLDAHFLSGLRQASASANNDVGTAIYQPGNEPGFLLPVAYHFVPGNAWRSVARIRNIVDQFYTDTAQGYPGNTDAGAIPSWLTFHLIGLYPLTPLPIYLLTAPRFSKLRLNLFRSTSSASSLEIVSHNLSATSFFPREVRLDGQLLTRNWISHDELRSAKRLEFFMADQPSTWDKNGEKIPSLSLGTL